MQTKRPLTSVVIPTLNEAQNLPLVLPYVPAHWVDEVILVDGRSTDGTCDVARQLLPDIKIVLEPRRGKGVAMRAGFAAAQGDIIITMDADGSNDPREIPRLVRALTEGADFVKGSRFAPGGGTTDMPRYRKWGNRGLGALVNWLFNGEYTDLCYGYHAFWRYCLDVINLDDARGFEIDTLIYVRALQNRLRITEVPSFEGYRFFGVGKLQTIPDGWRVLRTILAEWRASFRSASQAAYLGFRGGQPLSALALDQTGASGAAPDSLNFLATLRNELAKENHTQVQWNLALHLVMNHLGAKSGSLMKTDERNDGPAGVLAYAGQVQLHSSRQLLDVFENGLAGWVAQHRQPALIASTQSDARWLSRPWDDHQGLSRSAISAPLIFDDHVIGIITLVRPNTNPFTHEDLMLLMMAAYIISYRLQNEQLEPGDPAPAFADSLWQPHPLAPIASAAV